MPSPEITGILVLFLILGVYYFNQVSDQSDKKHIAARQSWKRNNPEKLRVENLQIIEDYESSQENLIKAIQKYRERHGVGLKCADEIVQQVIDDKLNPENT